MPGYGEYKEGIPARKWVKNRKDGAPLLLFPSEPISLFPLLSQPLQQSLEAPVVGNKDASATFLSLGTIPSQLRLNKDHNSGSQDLLNHRPL